MRSVQLLDQFPPESGSRQCSKLVTHVGEQVPELQLAAGDPHESPRRPGRTAT